MGTTKKTRKQIEEEATVEALAVEFRQSLIAYFSKRMKETSEVEDLVQEVFVRLAKRSGAGNIQFARAYIFQTASSVWYDWLRRRKVRAIDKHQEFTARDHGREEITPERVLIGRARLAQAKIVLMEMPERTRTIFVLRRLEGLPYKDIAVRLGISISAVEKHMVRAVLHLNKGMDGE